MNKKSKLAFLKTEIDKMSKDLAVTAEDCLGKAKSYNSAKDGIASSDPVTEHIIKNYYELSQKIESGIGMLSGNLSVLAEAVALMME